MLAPKAFQAKRFRYLYMGFIIRIWYQLALAVVGFNIEVALKVIPHKAKEKDSLFRIWLVIEVYL